MQKIISLSPRPHISSLFQPIVTKKTFQTVTFKNLVTFSQWSNFYKQITIDWSFFLCRPFYDFICFFSTMVGLLKSFYSLTKPMNYFSTKVLTLFRMEEGDKNPLSTLSSFALWLLKGGACPQVFLTSIINIFAELL